ncbi:MAG TPA: alcohol dehydrogenase catalytic domain-containing protein [Beutenbergiaceae bacterium]|nr:alcohol dehydrogenase catalytic domain-containing protein [Beutenbergiaceae bacterium]
MLSAVLNAPGDLELVDRPIPEPGPGEVLLAVEATTLCGTDLRVLRGEKTSGVRPGVVIGHEIAGRVAAVGQGVRAYQVGRQATVSIVVSCGGCDACFGDLEHLCRNLELFGYGIDGGLSEYLLVPERAVRRGNVIQTDAELPPTHLALAEPLSCCLNAADQYQVRPGDTVVVLGAGPIGLLHTQLALASGAKEVLVANRGAERRQVAERLGAALTVDPSTEDLAAIVRERTGGRGAEVVVVCIGVPELAQLALDVAAIGGRVNYFAGFPKGSTSAMEPNVIHYEELVVTGGSNARRRDVVRAVAMLEKGMIDAEQIVTHTFGLAQVQEAMTAVADKTGIKIAVVPTSR